MSNDDFVEFKSKYIESPAYHEAGHVVSAVLQRMPLRERGIHVDNACTGCSYYWDRSPGDNGGSEHDQREREQTIIALYSGPIAQLRFFQGCSNEDWRNDFDKLNALLDEQYPPNSLNRQRASERLRKRAEDLVDNHWEVIQALAATLISRPYSNQPECERSQGWSRSPDALEKVLTGGEVVAFFASLGLAAYIMRE